MNLSGPMRKARAYFFLQHRTVLSDLFDLTREPSLPVCPPLPQIVLPVFGVEEEPSPSALYENGDLITINVFDEIIMERPESRVVRRR